MQIILTENEIKNAIVMFLQNKMNIDDTVDVELSTQGRGGQTVVATVDLNSAKNSSKTSQEEPKKEEDTEALPEAEKTQEEAVESSSGEALFSETETVKEPAIDTDDSPFGGFV